MGLPPPRGRPFLTARWTNLILANFAVPDRLLKPLLPPGLELDQFEGRSYVSVVAFDFFETRVLGVGWPGYRNFPEVNLRFYVRAGADRGVCFIREYVPLRAVAWLAKFTYNEPYAITRMASRVADGPVDVTVEHRMTRNGRDCVLRATGRKPADQPAAGERFFIDHRWGFGRSRGGSATRFEVRHPPWDVYPIRDARVDLDWSGLYGDDWAVLQNARPDSTVLVAGSPVAVYANGRM
jgi:uncharacterized protein YqjF (DUF2071 family)